MRVQSYAEGTGYYSVLYDEKITQRCNVSLNENFNSFHYEKKINQNVYELGFVHD